MDIRFEVVGLPVAQGRARARVVMSPSGSHYPVFYDPAESVDWKQTVKVQAIPYRPPKPSDAPIAMNLVFRLPRPTSLPKRITRHVRKPDLDNLVKAVKDALRQVFYRDDSQIVYLVASKEYSSTPGVEIMVVEWEA